MENKNMENFSYRKRARVAAYIDVVLSTITLIVTPPFILFLPRIVTKAKILGPVVVDAFFLEFFSDDDIVHYIIPAWCLMEAVLCIVNIWAANMLFLATNEGVDARTALLRARIWRDAAGSLLPFDVINWACALFILHWWIDLSILGWSILLSISVIFRTVLLFFIGKLIDEVDMLTRLKGQQLA